MTTLNQLVGHDDPVFIDWVPALAFPCQQPMKVKYGVLQVPKWRILPDADDIRNNSQTWMSGKAGGPLGITEAMMRPTLLPTYLRNNWGRDWGSLQTLTQLEPAAPAHLAINSSTKTGLWSPGPMRPLGY